MSEENWTAEIDRLEGLSNSEKNSSKRALQKITQILGKNVSTLLVERRPITNYVFVNRAPWTWKWLVSLAEAIELVLRHPNASKLINMLKNHARFNDALFQLYIARCIIDTGFRIHFGKQMACYFLKSL